MTERYIDLQMQLYELAPDPDIVAGFPNAKSAPKRFPAQTSQPRLAKILRRLERLEADILFDRYDADQKWSEKRSQLAKAAAQRRKLQLDERNRLDATTSDQREGDTATVGPGGGSHSALGEDLDLEALGDFFSSLPDAGLTTEDGPTNSIPKESLSRPLNVRDFGKWNGMSPRRILEDACKARSVPFIDFALGRGISSRSSYADISFKGLVCPRDISAHRSVALLQAARRQCTMVVHSATSSTIPKRSHTLLRRRTTGAN